MILRRVISHFRKQEWTAIALDFLIVVVGVFIGIQVSNWNEQRRERAIEHQYLERLYGDLQESMTPKPDRVTWNETRMAQQELILSRLRSGVLPEADRRAFEQGLALCGFVSGIDVDWATVDELQSTGAMNIIRDIALRSLIVKSDSDLRRRQSINENLRASIYAFRHQIAPRFGVVEFSGEDRDISLDYDFEALAADPEFVNTLSQIHFLSQFILDITDTQTEDLRHLSDEVALRLGLEAEPPPVPE